MSDRQTSDEGTRKNTPSDYRVIEEPIFWRRSRSVELTPTPPPDKPEPVRRPAKVARQLALAHHLQAAIERGLALGLGRENVDQRVLDALRQVSNLVDAPLASAVETMSPLLELMDDGVYLVSRVPHYPTNGEGQPFWALYHAPLARPVLPVTAAR